jgi:uncharacterized membrane protein
VALRKYLLTGVLVWLPLAVTTWLLLWLVDVLDTIWRLVLTALGAVLPSSTVLIESLRNVPGLGVVLVVSVLFITGALVSNVAGRWWFRQMDRLFTHIPIVKSVYASVKKVSDTLFSSNGQAFRKALLIQYPRAGCWTIAFQTGVPGGEMAEHLRGDWLSVYVPTTPNPTSGFFLMLPRTEVVELRMGVDEALTYVISIGSLAPTPVAPMAAPATP